MLSIRILLFLLLAYLLWRIGYRWYQTFLKNQEAKQALNSATVNKEKHGVMVQCKYCGLHLPEHEAIHTSKGTYCCEAHRRNAES
jgi:uncharacterized protein